MSEPRASFYAHGKLLLSGEYFVLAGARALALPVRYGQGLDVFEGEEAGVLQWESLDEKGSKWLQLRFSLPGFELLDGAASPEAVQLQAVLRAVTALRGGDASWLQGRWHQASALQDAALRVCTRLEFPRVWGLGSSSAFLSCLAQWAGVDAYELLEATFGGSGYDLAAAVASSPIFFQRLPASADGKPEVLTEPVLLDYPFREMLYFVHLGRKQNSREGIRRFQQHRAQMDPGLVHRISELSEAFSICRKAEDFSALMAEHETLVGKALDMVPLQQAHFPDFPGTLKSLGAWGGDFALALSAEPEERLRAYFNQKGLELLLSWDDLVL